MGGDVADGFGGDVAADGRAGPHDADVGVEPGAEGRLVGARVRAGVVGRAHDERGDARVGADEGAVEVVEHAGLHLGLGALAADVIEEHREGTHAEVVHHPEFLAAVPEVVHHPVAVLVGPADVAAGVDGPDEVDVVFARGRGQFADLGGLFGRVGFAPPVGEPVERVVLGAVDVGVELEPAVEPDLGEARGMFPRGAVEPLDGAAPIDVGPVGDVQCGQAPAGAADHLGEGLLGVERPGAIGGRDADALAGDRQGIGTGLARHAGLGEDRRGRIPGDDPQRAAGPGDRLDAGRRQGLVDDLVRLPRRGRERPAVKGPGLFRDLLGDRVDLGRSGRTGRRHRALARRDQRDGGQAQGACPGPAQG